MAIISGGFNQVLIKFPALALLPEFSKVNKILTQLERVSGHNEDSNKAFMEIIAQNYPGAFSEAVVLSKQPNFNITTELIMFVFTRLPGTPEERLEFLLHPAIRKNPDLVSYAMILVAKSDPALYRFMKKDTSQGVQDLLKKAIYNRKNRCLDIYNTPI